MRFGCRAGEHGQATVEWAGVVVLVALIVAALVAVGIPTSVADAVDCNVKKVLADGGGSCAQRPGEQPPGKEAGPGEPPPGSNKTPGPGSLPPGFKPPNAFGHCGPDGTGPLPGRWVESHAVDYLIPGVYIGDLCNWHDHCTAWTGYLKDGYNCDMLLLKAMLVRCSQAPAWKRVPCDADAINYFNAVEIVHPAVPGTMPNHGPPPPQVGYPPGVHH